MPYGERLAEGHRTPQNHNIVVRQRQRGEGRAVNHLHRRVAQQIRGTLRGGSIRFDMLPFPRPARGRRPVNNDIWVKIAINM